MVKKQEEDTIYDLSLIGHVTEIVNDVLFEEFKKITYAKLDKEWEEQRELRGQFQRVG